MRQMKRTFESVAGCTRSKKPRLVPPLVSSRLVTRPWVAATHLYNWFGRDPIVDYFESQNRRGTRNNPAYTQSSGFVQFIMKKGVEFETKLVKYINDNKIEVVTASDTFTDAGCARTIELMKEGVPLIHSAPVKHSDNTGGIIDLLVRSDYIENLVDECPIGDDQKQIPAPLLARPYHYLVVDVKFTTLPLRADGRLLLNSGHFPAYKSQCWIYTKAIGEIQGYTPKLAFVMGRRWKYTSRDIPHHNFTCLSKLGVIDYGGVDKEYISRTRDAVKWVRDLKKHGHTWSVDPPSRPELFPNMCVDAGKWNDEKERLAVKNKEITSVWYCGVKHRENAVSQDITSWMHKECTANSLGIRGLRAPVIDAILDINRHSEDKIRPAIIKCNMFDWKTPGNDVYVDFETLPDICSDFSDLPNQKTTSMIFMIGVGRVDDGVWSYKRFLAQRPDKEEEFRIMDEFITHLTGLHHPRVFYWHAEDRFWKTSEDRQFNAAHNEMNIERKDRISDGWQVKEWCDLSKLFRKEPIVMKGLFKFGLKEVAAAMRRHGMIDTVIESDCSSGMTACVRAWECYATSTNPSENAVMNDIGRYNEFDTKVLMDIRTYLQRNHC